MNPGYFSVCRLCPRAAFVSSCGMNPGYFSVCRLCPRVAFVSSYGEITVCKSLLPWFSLSVGYVQPRLAARVSSCTAPKRRVGREGENRGSSGAADGTQNRRPFLPEKRYVSLACVKYSFTRCASVFFSTLQLQLWNPFPQKSDFLS